ncbi:MAG: tol-pal system-associated acyl-CoA thioesterase [Burkholderiaceae bacterium]|nr:tol-pal system-associated acyl-CoA thioesterase [Burkholderiaceae bacterium]
MGLPDPALFRHPVRVYWEDTDAGGVVFYANYLKFFERARTEWLRAAGIAQQALREDTGAIFVVSDTTLRYLAPARLDDALSVTVQPTEASRASLALAQQAWRGDQLLCEGTIRIACVDAGTFRPRRLPLAITELLARSQPLPR